MRTSIYSGLFFALSVVLFTPSSFAKASPFPPAPIFTDLTPLPTPTQGVGVIADAEKAQQLLVQQQALQQAQNQVSASTTLQIPLMIQRAHQAQADLRLGIPEKTIRKNLDQMKLPREISFIFFDTQQQTTVRLDGLYDEGIYKPIAFSSPEFPSVTIKVKGLSAFTYSYPGDRFIMLAVRYPRWTEVLQKKVRIGVDEEMVVKTPNQKEFLTPDVARYGQQLLDSEIQQAYQDLQSRQTASRAQSGKLLVEAVDKDLVEALFIIEHSSLAELQQKPQAVIDRFRQHYAINPTTAYADRESHMGARGIGQFMPATYNRLAKRSDLGLIQDLEKGTSNTVNTAKASAALLDAMQAELPKELSVTSSIRLVEALAGSYNGGSSRVKTIMSRDVWYDQIDGKVDRMSIKKRSRVPGETIDYIKKIRIVWPILKQEAAAPVI